MQSTFYRKNSGLKRKVIFLVQVNVTVQYDGKNYLTNVITSNDMSEDEIFQLALEQVRQQWDK